MICMRGARQTLYRLLVPACLPPTRARPRCARPPQRHLLRSHAGPEAPAFERGLVARPFSTDADDQEVYSSTEALGDRPARAKGRPRKTPDSPAVEGPAQSPVELRVYQSECIEACTRALADGLKRIAVSAPTGSGKTVIFSNLLKKIPPRLDDDDTTWTGREHQRGGQVLILVPSVEIAKQTAASVARAHPDLTVDMEQGRREASGSADVTVATVATLAARDGMRLAKFDPAGFKAVIIDEAHHACAGTWRQVLEYFHPAMRGRAYLSGDEPTASEQDTPTKEERYNTPLIGFSATLMRSDGLALGLVFEKIVYHNGMLDLMNLGHLAPLRFTMIQGHLDLSPLRVSAAARPDTEDGQGDFTASSMDKALNTHALNELLVKTWLYRCWNLPSRPAGIEGTGYRRQYTLVFCATRSHMAGVVDAYRGAGVSAFGVDSLTPAAERAALLQRFRAGEFPVLVNVGVFTEGTDIPPVDCILIARPTRSQGRYQQMIGRGTRRSLETGKVDCLVLDYVSAAEGARGAVCAPTLFGLDPREAMDEVSLDELRARKKENERKRIEGPQSAPIGALQPEQPDAAQLPKRVTMTDYDSIASLQEAIDVQDEHRNFALSASQLAWTDCGNDTYILTIPAVGRIRVEPSVEADEQEIDDDGDENEDFVPLQKKIELEIKKFERKAANPDLDRAPVWLGTFVRQINLPGQKARHARAQVIVKHHDLVAAIRACDTYAVAHGGVGRKTMLRSAPWRQGPISEGQAKFIGKRLGLTVKGARDMGLDQITRGEAQHMITRLTNGQAKKYARGVSSRLKQRQSMLNVPRKEQRRGKKDAQTGPAMDVFGVTVPRL